MYKAKCTYDEGDILSMMPPAMQLAFCSQLYYKAVQTVPIFRRLSEPVLNELCMLAKPMLAVRLAVLRSCLSPRICCLIATPTPCQYINPAFFLCMSRIARLSSSAYD